MFKTLNTLIVFCVLACTILVGCSKEERPPTQKEIVQTQQYNQKSLAEPIQIVDSDRYTIVRVKVFEDNTSYTYRRSIYEITDTKTGKEYFGVSGIGIVEINVK